jgi:hypothetical protein
MRRLYKALNVGIVTVAITSIIVLSLISWRDRERIVTLESRIAVLEKAIERQDVLYATTPRPRMEKDGFPAGRIITLR